MRSHTAFKGIWLSLALTVLGAGVTACGSDELPQEDCSIATQNQFVYALMRDVYLWNNLVPALNPLDFDSPYAVMEATAYRKLDRWSGIAEARAREDLIERGRFVGTGHVLVGDRHGNLRVGLVHVDSPAARAGIKRGMTLVGINGYTVEQITEQGLWGTIEGDNEVGVEVTYTMRRLDGEEVDFVVEKDVVAIRSVLANEILELGDRKVGYLLFTGFFGISDAELREAFSGFKKAQIDELVLDLRYNGGGLVGTAILLGSLILGDDYVDMPFIRLTHNQNLSAQNTDLVLAKEESSLSLKRIVVLADVYTASASELVMNGLKAYIPVDIVGLPTHGKPVGSNSWEECGQAVVPITFQLLNAAGEGDYFGGIQPTCATADDFTQELGSPEEVRLAQALALLRGEGCFDRQITLAELERQRRLRDALSARQAFTSPMAVFEAEADPPAEP